MEEGEQIHGHAFKFGFQFDARVQTSLLDLYGGFRRVADARRVFEGVLLDGRSGGDVQLWNTMISGCNISGDFVSAEKLFDEMPSRNTFTWVEMIKGYAAAGKKESLWEFISKIDLSKKEDFDRVVVFTAATTGLLACGDIMKARELFDEMPNRDVAAWNAMISGYTSAGRGDLAFDLFCLMLEVETSMRPNGGTIVAAATAAAQLGSTESARRVSACIEDEACTILLDSRVAAALIDMHAKCGDLQGAQNIFQRSKCKDLVCYSSMISSLGVHGKGNEAIQIFHELLAEGLKPDGICFVSVLAACSHTGLVDEGRKVFESMMQDHGIAPTAEHYVCMVDMLGRAGYIEEARRIIDEEMAPTVGDNEVVWGALLSACRSHQEVAVAEVAALRLIRGEFRERGAMAAGQLIVEKSFDRNMETVVGDLNVKTAETQQLIGEELCDLDTAAKAATAQQLIGKELCEEELHDFLPDQMAGNAGDYVLLSNVYAASGKWEDAAAVRVAMRRQGVQKLPGWSCLDCGGSCRMERFLTGQISDHPGLEPVLRLLFWELSGEGFLHHCLAET